MNSVIERLQLELSASLEGLESTQTQLRPPTGFDKWCIRQIVDHLLLTYARTQNAFEERLTKGRPNKTPVTLNNRIGQFFVTVLGYFPSGREAPTVVYPDSSVEFLSGQQLLSKVHASLARLDTLCDQAEAAFGRGQIAPHHVLGPLSAPQWRKFHLAPGRHHIRQILAIRRDHRL